ncbi:Kynureninase (L-kynurenine hydrolase) [Kickxella alabastrina]|uniref:Kynureninase (L-kynurenine hydrolase) n=1 Tax=Kickxella alabastrina TaxID=61397 RepID=A0ACC1I7A5_9FUNG|nr:Kynureninase (L-kynurenine hydrolase) [Kickxella alabastrina]
MDYITAVAAETGLAIDSEALALALDARDELRELRDEFSIPAVGDVAGSDPDSESGSGPDSASGSNHNHDPAAACTYLAGNSLGLMPRRARQLVGEELDEWARRGVVGHRRHSHGRAWVAYRERVVELMAPLVGAGAREVGVMASLTSALHLLLAAFYRPHAQRTRILLEAHAFPSDHYAAESQAQWHGLGAGAVLLAEPRAGELVLRTDDVLALLAERGSEIAVVLLSGVQYYTGQAFDMARITAAARAAGCVVGWDLAHAAGNVALQLHAWGADFACWCTYKYLNAGPGGVAGFFVHERHGADHPRLKGWWGHDAATRFDMTNAFAPAAGAAGFEVSNTPVLAAAALLGSLQVFARAGGMARLRAKSERLTALLERLLQPALVRARIITPCDPAQRGAQLSVVFDDADAFAAVFSALAAAGVVCDERKPSCIRIAPAPLYNSYADVWRCAAVIAAAIAAAITADQR